MQYAQARRTICDERSSTLGGRDVALPHDYTEVLARREDAMRRAARGKAFKPEGKAYSQMARRAVLTGLAVPCGVRSLCAGHPDSETFP
ncbi:hypothetical protein XaFJ1_GM000329 [Xanthomonas albilineans]|nr:hypothetical protein XaFJ1_GM000329 [Xanthomonas albilineans]